jgi:hypothetical protein
MKRTSALAWMTITLAVLVLSSCTALVAVLPDTKAYLAIDFISECCGPNTAAMDEWGRIVGEYKQRGLEPRISVRPWGREGEQYHCVELSSLPTSERRAFVSNVQRRLGTFRLVHIEEVQMCRFR